MFPGLSFWLTCIIVSFCASTIANWLLNLLFVFIVKYLIIYHNLMQLTNIDEIKIISKIRLFLWILSFALEVLDGIFVSDITSTFYFGLFRTGSIQIPEEVFQITGMSIFTLLFITFLVVFVVQARIELDSSQGN